MRLTIIHYLCLLPHNKQHIALKNKAKKGLLFFALLLGFFAFSGAVNVARRNSPLTQSELTVRTDNVLKSAIRYKSAARQLYKTRGSFLADKHALTATTMVFDRLVNTLCLHLTRLTLPQRQVFFQYYTNIPHAAGPAQPAYRA